MSSVRDQLLVVFSDLFGVPLAEIRPSFSPDDCETWDSISHLNLVAAIEENFGIIVLPEEQADMLSFEIVEDIVAAKVAGR